MELTDEQIAHLCYEAIRKLKEILAAPALPAWEDLPQLDKDEITAGVNFCRVNPAATGEAVHNEWLSLRLSNGWRYAATRDDTAKEHPDVLMYPNLTSAAQAKYVMFKAAVAIFTTSA
jgi:hypothetical protein